MSLHPHWHFFTALRHLHHSAFGAALTIVSCAAVGVTMGILFPLIESSVEERGNFKTAPGGSSKPPPRPRCRLWKGSSRRPSKKRPQVLWPPRQRRQGINARLANHQSRPATHADGRNQRMVLSYVPDVWSCPLAPEMPFICGSAAWCSMTRSALAGSTYTWFPGMRGKIRSWFTRQATGRLISMSQTPRRSASPSLLRLRSPAMSSANFRTACKRCHKSFSPAAMVLDKVTCALTQIYSGEDQHSPPTDRARHLPCDGCCRCC